MHFNISQEPLYTEIYRKIATPRIACTVEMHFNVSKEPLYTDIYRKNATPQFQPRTRTHTLREPGQSTCISTFHKSQFIRKFTGKCRAPDWAQNADTHFVRACAVEMHDNVSQEPLYTEICSKNAADQIEPRMRTHTLCESAQSKCTSTFHKSHFIRKFTGKMPRPRMSTLIKHRPRHLP